MNAYQPPHLVFVGLPGSGKSTVGALIAARLAAPFLDFDLEIERREGMSVQRIFAERGEQAFRALEHSLTLELADQRAMVLAPGGGWVSDPSNRKALGDRARVIHLEVSVDRALERLGAAVVSRPLLAGPAAKRRLEELAAVRMPLYGMADASINTEVITPQEVVDSGLRLASAWGWPIG